MSDATREAIGLKKIATKQLHPEWLHNMGITKESLTKWSHAPGWNNAIDIGPPPHITNELSTEARSECEQSALAQFVRGMIAPAPPTFNIHKEALFTQDIDQ